MSPEPPETLKEAPTPSGVWEDVTLLCGKKHLDQVVDKLEDLEDLGYITKDQFKQMEEVMDDIDYSILTRKDEEDISNELSTKVWKLNDMLNTDLLEWIAEDLDG